LIFQSISTLSKQSIQERSEEIFLMLKQCYRRHVLVKIYFIATTGHVTLAILKKYVESQSKHATSEENTNLSN
jgi:REP element-mobilizing transposase RayT